mgnify:CR=1 FL=1
MFMKKYIFATLLAASCCMMACDDGRIFSDVDVDHTGRSAKLSGTITGLDRWAEGYTVALAGFADGDDYACIAKAVQADANGNVMVTMTNIPGNVTSVQLCVLDRLRRHVVTLSEADTEGIRDTIRMDVGTVDASMFGVIQKNFLNTTCTSCHGASNTAAAGLYLTEGRAYAAMVGVDSRRVSGHKLVAPGDADGSVLHMVLNQQSVEGVSMDHFDLVSEQNAQTMLPLIDSWINNGAGE